MMKMEDPFEISQYILVFNVDIPTQASVFVCLFS